ncbi:hypothetical protein [Amantichitinum ursilacus]|uniref:Uncharacterized protein n=1 Tax=Amantichitinum ursilacus TaxID=857265 RepID=A0A0N0XK58_9NEIS|nr:hypothetical protein [Amantichitinum ursilacus]KPC54169.1 hypothetical protein WG78_05950 [Amantichitinum ursilacus]
MRYRWFALGLALASAAVHAAPLDEIPVAFGLHQGQTLSELAAYQPSAIPTGYADTWRMPTAPTPVAPLNKFEVVISPQTGLCSVSGRAEASQPWQYAAEGLALQAALIKQYGKGLDVQDAAEDNAAARPGVAMTWVATRQHPLPAQLAAVTLGSDENMLILIYTFSNAKGCEFKPRS